MPRGTHYLCCFVGFHAFPHGNTCFPISLSMKKTYFHDEYKVMFHHFLRWKRGFFKLFCFCWVSCFPSWEHMFSHFFYLWKSLFSWRKEGSVSSFSWMKTWMFWVFWGVHVSLKGTHVFPFCGSRGTPWNNPLLHTAARQGRFVPS